MTGLRLLSCVFVLAPAAAPHARYPLTPDAIVADLKIESDAKQAEDMWECKGFRMSAAQVRERFRTYRELGPGEYHDYYAWYPCSAVGTIRYHGRTFHFYANKAHTLSMDWPDGRDKLLGGSHDGDLSD